MDALRWHRDSQGLSAEGRDNDGEVLRYYVRKHDGSDGYRLTYVTTAVIGGTRYGNEPVVQITVADLQREAKAVAEAFDADTQAVLGTQSRVIRAIYAAYRQ